MQSDGKLLAEYAKEKRFSPAALGDSAKRCSSPLFRRRIRISIRTRAIDLSGTLRALMKKNNMANAGRPAHSLAGGSTITQQVVKNFLLTNEKSFERKIKEVILAYRISSIYSKDKILELYLNEIYLGQSTYGVAAASVNYFDKSLDQLSTEEVAFLAALAESVRPILATQRRITERALDRRNYVITRMHEDGYIDEKEEKRALAMPIVTRQRNKDELAHADFFAEEVRRALATMYGSNVLYEGGLFVKTTLKPNFQDHAERSLRYALMMYDQRHGYRGPMRPR